MAPEETKTEGRDYGGFIVFIIISVMAMLALAWTFKEAPTNAENALESYRGAVELCGEGNIQKTEFTDGSTDFTCRDYSKVPN